MEEIIYVVDDNENKNYKYNIEKDTIIYHFSINSSSDVELNLAREGVSVRYYYNNINYDDNKFSIKVNHLKSKTHSEIFNHGVNVFCNKLMYYVDGIVLKDSSKCICNQDNQIINMDNGKSTICPNLLIDNYDVDSNHAAYIGKFKDDMMFYMMSRGISREVAYRLLLQGFLVNNTVRENDKIKLFLDEIEKI